MTCIGWLRYKWFVWFSPKNKRKPTEHPMQHILRHEASRTIIVDVGKLHSKKSYKSKFEIVDGR